MRRAILLVASTGLAMLLATWPAWAALVPAADWQMNETSGQMLDSSGNGNDGNPTDVIRTGSTYVFDGSTSRVAVPDNDSLDPAGRDITLKASVAVPEGAMKDDSYDVVRKGLSGTAGGDYKMEIKRTTDPTVGNLNCVFKGDVGTVNRLANVDVVDGRWHALECVKTSGSVVARVDGTSYAKTGKAGSIANGKEALVGAKTTDPFDDVFEGSMDFVGIDIDDATAPEPPADVTAPTVENATPTGKRVSPKANLRAAFSEAMDEATITKSTFKLVNKGATRKIAATVSYDAVTMKAVLNPTNKLKRGTTYKATITTAAKDSAGNALDQKPGTAGDQPKSWRFKVRR